MVWQFLKTVVHKLRKLNRILKKLFQKNNVKSTIPCNLKIVNLTLKPADSAYQPYHTPNNEICYNIHQQSDHLLSIIRQPQISVGTWLINMSSNKNEFDESVSLYQETLTKSSQNHKLKFQEIISTNTQGENGI